ncbi:MAG: hypothetical protein HOE90_18295 [Bacteriovoracaceae bacterium]|nr:hypothetical protein [Bacteriovoracaceae bacterium]
MKNHYLLLMLLLISNNLFAALDSPVIFVGPDDYAKDRVHFNIYKIQENSSTNDTFKVRYELAITIFNELGSSQTYIDNCEILSVCELKSLKFIETLNHGEKSIAFTIVSDTYADIMLNVVGKIEYDQYITEDNVEDYYQEKFNTGYREIKFLTLEENLTIYSNYQTRKEILFPNDQRPGRSQCSWVTDSDGSDYRTSQHTIVKNQLQTLELKDEKIYQYESSYYDHAYHSINYKEIQDKVNYSFPEEGVEFIKEYIFSLKGTNIALMCMFTFEIEDTLKGKKAVTLSMLNKYFVFAELSSAKYQVGIDLIEQIMDAVSLRSINSEKYKKVYLFK